LKQGEENMTTQRAAILELSLGILRDLLHLPDGAEIISVYAPIDQRGTIEVRIEGAGWPTDWGAVIQRTKGIVHQRPDGDGIATIDWQMPE
jgi:hypothetical protein